MSSAPELMPHSPIESWDGPNWDYSEFGQMEVVGGMSFSSHAGKGALRNAMDYFEVATDLRLRHDRGHGLGAVLMIQYADELAIYDGRDKKDPMFHSFLQTRAGLAHRTSQKVHYDSVVDIPASSRVFYGKLKVDYSAHIETPQAPIRQLFIDATREANHSRTAKSSARSLLRLLTHK